MPEPRISGVVVTLNEEENLGPCLDALAWCDERLVVDMHSEDRTREVASERGARVLLHERVGFVEPARNFAISECSGDWVMVVDADEIVPGPLASALRAVAAAGLYDVVDLPFQNFVFGEKLVEGPLGLHRERHPRFFRRGALSCPSGVHEAFAIEPGSRVYAPPAEESLAIGHFSYLDSAQWFEKMNRYTSIGARGRYTKGERASPPGMATIALLARKFAKHYLKERGYADGRAGFLVSLYLALYEVLEGVKLWEQTAGRSAPEVRARYREVKRGLIEERLEGLGARQGT